MGSNFKIFLIDDPNQLRIESSAPSTLEKNRVSHAPRDSNYEPSSVRTTRHIEFPTASKPSTSSYKLNLEYASPVDPSLSVRNSNVPNKYSLGESAFQFYSPKHSSHTNNLISQSLSNFNPLGLSSTRFYEPTISRPLTTEKPNLESKRFYEPPKVENNYYSYQNGELTPSNRQFYKEIHSKQF